MRETLSAYYDATDRVWFVLNEDDRIVRGPFDTEAQAHAWIDGDRHD